MDYTLVKPNGQEMKFYLLEIAELYQTIDGGRILYKGRPLLRLVDKMAA
jgi:hypothetical protein